MRNPVVIASILVLLAACDKAEENAAPAPPPVPLSVITPTSTILFEVFGSSDDPRVLPIAMADGGRLSPITLDAAGWRTVDSMFFAKGRKLPIYRSGADAGAVEIVRGMWSDEGELYTLPGCTALLPQAKGRIAAKGEVDPSVEYLASTTPLTTPKTQPRLPRDAEAKGRSLAKTVAAGKELGNEELANLEFVGRWLPTGAGPTGITLLASFVDPNAGDAGPGAGHSVMILALAEDSAGTMLPSYQHVSSGEARSVEFQRLLNHADLDGDGIDELLLDESTYGGQPSFVVLKYAAGRWRAIFRVSQDWCLDVKPAR